jgi:hypothetical protein
MRAIHAGGTGGIVFAVGASRTAAGAACSLIERPVSVARSKRPRVLGSGCCRTPGEANAFCTQPPRTEARRPIVTTLSRGWTVPLINVASRANARAEGGDRALKSLIASMGVSDSPPSAKQRISLTCLLSPAPATRRSFLRNLLRTCRKARKQRAFVHSTPVSTFPFRCFGWPSGQKSPAHFANTPDFWRPRLETWFDCNCQGTAPLRKRSPLRASA